MLAQIGTMVASIVAAIAAMSVAYLSRRQIRVEAELAHERNRQLQDSQDEKERRRELHAARMLAYTKLLADIRAASDSLNRHLDEDSADSWRDFHGHLNRLSLSREEMFLVAGRDSAEAATSIVEIIVAAALRSAEKAEWQARLNETLEKLLTLMRTDLHVNSHEIVLVDPKSR
uniref:hypothetical protein n=1 Tax=Herbidospora sakaeratensis TaxID=564415 RepID=UPI000785E89D|nr:hypothetical protein [Herbidospora sakaeratensis]